MTPAKKRLGEMLIEAGIIDELQLTAALGQQRQWGGKLGSILIKMGFVTEKSLSFVLEKQLGVKCISIEGMEIPRKALHAVKLDIAKKYCIMPLDLDKNILSIAIADPTDVKTLDDLSFMLGVRINPVLAFESDIKKAIAQHYEGVAYIDTGMGKTYKPTTNSIEKMELTGTEPITQPPSKGPPERPSEKQEITSKVVIEALIALLLEKGIITRQELAKKIDEKIKKP